MTLIRHGRTAWNHQRRFLGTTDIPLDDCGRAQAARLGRELGGVFEATYSSPLARALQTAECLCAAPVVVPDLRELAQGELEGLYAAEAMARYPAFFEQWATDPTHAPTPGGERLGDCRDRAMAALDHLVSRHTSAASIVAVTHQLVIGSVACTAAGVGLVGWAKFGVKNTAGMVLEWDGVNWMMAGPCPVGTDLGIPPGSSSPDV